MSKRKPLIDENGEVRELTADDMKLFRPAQDVLPTELLEGLVSLRKQRGERGPQKTPTKERITIRLSRDVVERFRATGDGWQTRMDTALQDWLKTHSPA